MDEIRKIPPVTRFLCASSLSVSVSSMMHLVSPYKLVFVKELVTKEWEVSPRLRECSGSLCWRSNVNGLRC